MTPNQIREGFVITMGFEGSLVMYSKKQWRAMAEKYKNLPFTDRHARLFKRLFFSMASEVSLDRVGRLAIAESQRKAAEIDRELVFVGVEDHIEIWSPERWDRYVLESRDAFSLAAEQITRTYGMNWNGMIPPDSPAGGNNPTTTPSKEGPSSEGGD